MSYNIVLTTAEDIVAVVDAVIAKGTEAEKEFIAEFTGIATDDQVIKALQMACELQLIVFDSSRGCYGTPSFLAKKLVSASSDEQKAVFMRLILEQYAPYITRHDTHLPNPLILLVVKQKPYMQWLPMREM